MYSKLFPDASEEGSIRGHTFANAGQALAFEIQSRIIGFEQARLI